MMRLFRFWRPKDRRAEAVSKELPQEVKTAIAGATVIHRDVHDDEPNIIILTNGYGSFRYSLAGARKWLNTVFPELSEEQIARGLRYLSAHVAERRHLEEKCRLIAQGIDRPRWTGWLPLRLE